MRSDAPPGSCTVIELVGELDRDEAPVGRRVVRAAEERLACGLVLDVSRVTFLSSAGVSYVLRLADQERSKGHGVAFVAPTGTPARRVLEIVKASAFGGLCETVDEALEQARPAALN